MNLASIATLTAPECAAVLAAVAARLVALEAPATATPAPLLTARELAVALAVSLDTVYEGVRQGRIPAVRHGRALRFDLVAVRARFA